MTMMSFSSQTMLFAIFSLEGGARGARGRLVNYDLRARIDAMARIADRVSVDFDRAGLDQRFETRARQFTDAAGKQAVEPFAGLFRGYEDGCPHWRREGHELVRYTTIQSINHGRGRRVPGGPKGGPRPR